MYICLCIHISMYTHTRQSTATVLKSAATVMQSTAATRPTAAVPQQYCNSTAAIPQQYRRSTIAIPLKYRRSTTAVRRQCMLAKSIQRQGGMLPNLFPHHSIFFSAKTVLNASQFQSKAGVHAAQLFPSTTGEYAA